MGIFFNFRRFTVKIFHAALLGCVVIGFASAASASNLAFNQMANINGARLVVDEESMPDGDTYGGENAQVEQESPDAYTDESHEDATVQEEPSYDSENNADADQNANVDEGDE